MDFSQRVPISELAQHVGEEVEMAGWVDVRRDHGKLIFIDLRDESGKVQMVANPKNADAHKTSERIRPEWVITVKGIVKERPEKMINPNVVNGNLEIGIEEMGIISEASELPFEKDAELNFNIYLENLPLTLRADKPRAIFKVQSGLINAFRSHLLSEKFTEIQAPKIIGEDAEGGADAFKIDYFDYTASLAQSPQLYKQIMVGIFGRVFTTGNVYRAEKHATTRHLNEYTSLDIEVGFINDHNDVMRIVRDLLSSMMSEVKTACENELKLLEATPPTVPDEIPSLTLREAQDLIKKETGVDKTSAPDLDPEDERWLCEWSMKHKSSDFIFITHFPTSKRPFYTFRDENNPDYTKGFDLLFRGVEIMTGAQRMHRYDDLVESLTQKGLDANKFGFYLDAFKYGMPPHGGMGMGLERLTQKLLGLSNVKEATLFPRDRNRIDRQISRAE